MTLGITSIHRFGVLQEMLTSASSRDKVFAAPAFKSKLSEELDRLLARPDNVLSLDVFDTLLLRDNSAELTRFFEIGGRMASILNKKFGTKRRGPLKECSIRQVDAFVARHLGNKASYRASTPVNGCREGSLTEIHNTASRILVGSSEFAEAFITEELDYETTRLKINKLIVEQMRRHKARGGRVALITDMYMHASHVGHLLGALRVKSDLFDLLISSADVKVSKASGGIFALVEERMGAKPEDFVHVGDGFKGDFKKPKEHGWQALHLPLATTDIVARRVDHLKTAAMLNASYGLSIDVAMPN